MMRPIVLAFSMYGFLAAGEECKGPGDKCDSMSQEAEIGTVMLAHRQRVSRTTEVEEDMNTKAPAPCPGACLQARVLDFPNCKGYELVRYQCSEEDGGDKWCAACDPGGTPDKCAVPAGTPSYPSKGRCVAKDGKLVEYVPPKAAPPQAPCSQCYQAKEKDFPNCVGYVNAGYRCSEGWCAACNPGGTPDVCAVKAPDGAILNPNIGRCVDKDGTFAEYVPPKAAPPKAPCSQCYQAQKKDFRRCHGYEEAGYDCSEGWCAACDPEGTPDRCAVKAPAGTAPWKGKCVDTSGKKTEYLPPQLQDLGTQAVETVSVLKIAPAAPNAELLSVLKIAPAAPDAEPLAAQTPE